MAHTGQGHIDSTVSFFISSVIDCCQDQIKVAGILLNAFSSKGCCLEPGIVAGAGNIADSTKVFNQVLIRVPANHFINDFIDFVGFGRFLLLTRCSKSLMTAIGLLDTALWGMGWVVSEGRI